MISEPVHATKPTSRLTKRQRTVLDSYRKSGRAMTPQQVWMVAREAEPALGLATVYRAVKTLAENGHLHRVVLEHEEQSRYRACSDQHHHHFLCRICDRVMEIKGCVKNLGDIVPAGFTLEHHTITLYGVCKSCGDRP